MKQRQKAEGNSEMAYRVFSLNVIAVILVSPYFVRDTNMAATAV